MIDNCRASILAPQDPDILSLLGLRYTALGFSEKIERDGCLDCTNILQEVCQLLLIAPSTW